MEIKNFTSLMAKLKAKMSLGNKTSVVVGYTQNYAVYVHENLEANHPVGQAKFLEQPARELSNNGELARIVKEALLAKATMTQALLLAALRIQRESQQLVPVDTGALKGSAFTRKDEL